MAVTALNIVTDAMRDLGLLNASDPASGDDADFVLTKLNRLVDNLNAEREAIYDASMVVYTLTPALAPHTIGPTGTFVVTQRPVSLEGANLILTTSTPAVRVPINLRDEGWWLDVRVRALSTSIPTDVFYDAAWPNGALNFWPVPSTAYQVELWTRSVVAELALTTTFSMPPGYRDMITLTLEESLLGPFRVAGPPGLSQDAAKARGRVQANNVTVPTIVTQDAGMPGGRAATHMNYLTREIF